MQPLNCIGSVAGFLSALAEEIGHDKEVFITTVWQSEKPGSESWMADLHVRIPKHDPSWLDAEYGLADYAEAGGALVKKYDCPMPVRQENPEPEEHCEWCGRSYPKSEMNSIAWGGDESRVKRICDRCCDEGS